MKKIFLLVICACQLFVATAQKNAPKWLEKQRKAIVSITTYGSNNQVLNTGTGFYVSETGDLLASYKLFKSAQSAMVTDTDGKTFPVSAIIGADDMYGVIKVKVGGVKKVPFLTIASEPVAEQSTAYMVPYVAGKNGTFKSGPVTEVSTLKEPYGYYKVGIPFESVLVEAPLLTENGEVFGLSQEDAGGSKEHIYAVSAGYINTLRVASMDLLSSTYSSIGIKKLWPEDVDQAQISLFLMSSAMDGEKYLETLNDFIATFPNSPEGYLSRSQYYANGRKALAATPAEEADYLRKAMADMDIAIRNIPDKGEALYNKAKLIYNVAVTDTTLTDENWKVPAAMAVLQEAIKENDQPYIRQFEGDIYFTSGDYEKAYESYMLVNESDKPTPASFYWAAKAKENTPGPNVFEIITLLSGAIDISIENPNEETLVFLLERAEYRMQVMQYDEVIKDYDTYYELVKGQVDDSFFYYREQAKFRKGDMAEALIDIREALKRAPDNAIYLAEEASVLVRMEKYEEALKSINKAIALEPEFASCYRLKGLCYVRQGQKAEGCTAFQKAKELGDPVVDRLIKEHCQ